jgi:hypothetical protein
MDKGNFTQVIGSPFLPLRSANIADQGGKNVEFSYDKNQQK